MGLLALVLVSILVFNSSMQAFGQSSNKVISGVFSILNGDPAPGSGKRHITLYRVTDAQGVVYELDFGATVLPTGGILQLNRQKVKISGQLQTARNSVGTQGLQVQTIELDKTAPAPVRNIVGTQKFISLACKFGDISEEPRPLSFFTNQLGNSRPGFNHYFREMSFNRLNMDGSAAFGWFTLPSPRATYIVNGNANLNKLAKDCTDQAKNNAVNFTGAYGINMMFNGELDGAAWGGATKQDLDGDPEKFWPATWMPYYTSSTFGWLEHGILAHEMSHAFGAPHTGDSNGYQYGNSWDVVSNPQAGCYPSDAYPTPIPGSLDATYGCIGQHVSGVLKLGMGFYDSSKVFTYTNGSGAQTINIERQALPPNAQGTYLLAIIPSPTNQNVYYSVEARFRAPNSYDMKTRGDGTIIYRTDTSRNGQTVEQTWLLPPPGATADSERCPDAPGVCGVGAAQAIWAVGSTMNNPTDGVKIRIDAFSNDGTATITINPGTGATAPSITTQPQSTTINAGETATLTVAASGSAPLTYQWYQGTSGNTATPVGTNSASFTTPALFATTSYWVRVSNSAGNSDSNTATVTVSAPPSLVVTNPNDAGSPTDDNNQGTLTYALLNATAGQTITFNLTGGGNTINVTGPLPTAANGPIVLDGGSCNNGTPGLAISGTGVGEGVDGLVFNKNVFLKNLSISGFKGIQLKSAGGTVFGGLCVLVSKN